VNKQICVYKYRHCRHSPKSHCVRQTRIVTRAVVERSHIVTNLLENNYLHILNQLYFPSEICRSRRYFRFRKKKAKRRYNTFSLTVSIYRMRHRYVERGHFYRYVSSQNQKYRVTFAGRVTADCPRHVYTRSALKNEKPLVRETTRVRGVFFKNLVCLLVNVSYLHVFAVTERRF